MSNNIVVLVDKILLTEKKYITRLRKQEFLTLTETGKYNVEWCYDHKHSVITRKSQGGEAKREVSNATVNK